MYVVLLNAQADNENKKQTKKNTEEKEEEPVIYMLAIFLYKQEEKRCSRK